MLKQLWRSAREDPWKPLIVLFSAIGSVGIFKSEILDPVIIPLVSPFMNWFDGMRGGLAETGMPDSAALWISIFVTLYPVYEFLKHREKIRMFLSHNREFFKNGDESEN